MEQLTVSRSQGNRLYAVTPEQWQALAPRLEGEQLAPPTKPRPTRRTQGYSQSPAARRATELHAMNVATEHYQKLGYDVTDTSASKPYDLVARKAGERLFIEVKGTTGKGEAVLVTKNEVNHARCHPGECVLFVVSRIALSSDSGNPKASGGEVAIESPWSPVDERLLAMQYEYTLLE